MRLLETDSPHMVDEMLDRLHAAFRLQGRNESNAAW